MRPTFRPPVIDLRLTLGIIILIALLSSGAAYSRPAPAAPTPTPAATPMEPSARPAPTPFPAEILNNEQQTVGPSILAAVLVLVVTAGVLTRRPPRRPS